MSTFSRALRHINMKDVKRKHQKKIIERKIKEVEERKNREYINSILENLKYDWRKEINEGMTTTNVFFATLPATGDVNLAYPSWDIIGGQGYNVLGGSVTITGNPDSQNGFASSFDSNNYDTLVFDVSGTNILLGVLGTNSDPLLVVTSPGTYLLPVIPNSLASLIFTLAPGSGNATLSNLRYQRRTPLNVFIPLDNPEAVSFVRADPNLSNLSPEERNQKLKEMLAASDEYVYKALGVDFPGAGAVPPGEEPLNQPPPGQAGITPGVEIKDFDISKMTKDYENVAGSLSGPRGGDYGPSLKPDGTHGFPKPWELNKGINGWYEYVPGSGWKPIPSISNVKGV